MRGCSGSSHVPPSNGRCRIMAKVRQCIDALSLAQFLSSPDYQIADFGHVFHREADAFAAKPGIFDTTIGHVVYAVGGDIVDDHASDIKPVPCIEHLEKIAGEDASLQSELAIVDFFECCVEIAEAGEDGERAEGFLRIGGGCARYAFEQIGRAHV